MRPGATWWNPYLFGTDSAGWFLVAVVFVVVPMHLSAAPSKLQARLEAGYNNLLAGLWRWTTYGFCSFACAILIAELAQIEAAKFEPLQSMLGYGWAAVALLSGVDVAGGYRRSIRAGMASTVVYTLSPLLIWQNLVVPW